MSNNNSMNITHEQLQEILRTAIAEATKPNWLEQKKMDEEMERDRRRTILAVELGRAQEEKLWREQNLCTHCRNEKTGEAVKRGTGVWCTSGQAHTNDVASLICQRCATLWQFKVTPEEREYIINGPGLMGFAPPPIDRCLNKENFVKRPEPRLETVNK